MRLAPEELTQVTTSGTAIFESISLGEIKAIQIEKEHQMVRFFVSLAVLVTK